MIARAFPDFPVLRIVALLGLLAVPAHAAEPPRAASDIPVTRASSKTPCTCRAAGRSFEVGSEICLGNRMMRCTMAINVTSWEQTEQPCPQS
ncbi:MAG: hypothetical protein O9342_17545 [Beijerinckiaceae bacterium]|nr:hypothetical protein [Beijerinckiaceae bacterium]